MQARIVFGFALLLVAALGGLTALGGRPTQAAGPPRDPAAEIGRYQLIPDRDGRPVYLFDTASGRVWKPPFADLDGDWQEHIKLPKSN
jgi:hypothetical protein